MLSAATSEGVLGDITRRLSFGVDVRRITAHRSDGDALLPDCMQTHQESYTTL
jgi:hypothetical protein